MAVVTKRDEVLGIYEEARRRSWTLPCICTENLTSTEAILAAAQAHAGAIGVRDLPITLGICGQYADRTQSAYYTHTRRWDVGLRLFLADVAVLAGPGGPYEDLRVLVHLDHVQFDDDRELLAWDMAPFSSIMFDASRLPLEENIARTRRFVEERGASVVIEGACDEIQPPGSATTAADDLTTADKAERYLAGTGVDLVVANLGTEHRASGREQRYYAENARAIRDRIGSRLVLHGASSVPSEALAHLFGDGICKVNVWTALERDSSPVLFRRMLENASRVAGPTAVQALQREGLLGPGTPAGERISLAFCTTTYRQQVVFEAQRELVASYLALWCP